jgi:PadR family transcriptional regulator
VPFGPLPASQPLNSARHTPTYRPRVWANTFQATGRQRSGHLAHGQPVRPLARLSYYLLMTDLDLQALDRELKKGAAELLLLSVLEARPRHGYELAKLIETQSGGHLVFHLDSLYPLLYRLEERGWIKGTWVEKPGERRRRFYRLTRAGQRVLGRQRRGWEDFVEAVRLVTRGGHA